MSLIGPYASEAEALAACGDSDSDSGSGPPPFDLPEYYCQYDPGPYQLQWNGSDAWTAGGVPSSTISTLIPPESLPGTWYYYDDVGDLYQTLYWAGEFCDFVDLVEYPGPYHTICPGLCE